MSEAVFEFGSVQPDTGVADGQIVLRSLRTLRGLRRGRPSSLGAHSVDDAAIDIRMNRKYGYKPIKTARLNALGRRVLGDAPEEV